MLPPPLLEEYNSGSGQEAQRFGFGDGLLAAVDAQFAVDVAGMHLDRLI